MSMLGLQQCEMSQVEMWKPIPNFDGYEASNWGNVRSYKGRCKMHKTPHLLKPSIDNKMGYKGVNLRCNGQTHYRRIAHLVLLSFVGPRPSGMETCHNNSDPGDNRLENLRYDTHSGNMRDRLKLSDTQIIEMRERRANGERLGDLAQLFDISYGTTSNICRGISYVEIGGPFTTSGRGQGGGKLTIDDVIAMRVERANGKISLKDLGKKYGISESGTSLVCRGERYPDDGGPLMIKRNLRVSSSVSMNS